MDKLKPCPFCGKPGRIIERVGDPYRVNVKMKYICQCTDPKCIGRSRSMFKTEKEAISAWNRRASDAQ